MYEKNILKEIRNYFKDLSWKDLEFFQLTFCPSKNKAHYEMYHTMELFVSDDQNVSYLSFDTYEDLYNSFLRYKNLKSFT